MPGRRHSHRTRPPSRASQGFTLVELMISLLILAFGLLGVGRLLIFSQHHAYHGRSETTAVTLAEEIREKIMSEDYGDLVSLFDGVDTSLGATVTAPCTMWANHIAEQLGPTGVGTVQVLEPAEDPEISTGMLTIVIEVSWRQDGMTKSVPLRFSTTKMGI